MALIKCPECGHAISDRAVSCPSCGLPLSPLPQPELSQLTIEPPASHPESSLLQQQQQQQPESFLFAKVYAGCCFFGCLFAACFALIAWGQILQTGDWLNNPTTQKNTGALTAWVFMIALWSITGISILRRKRRAIMLTYVGACVAVFGILARGIIPLDVILAIPTIAIIPYLRNRSAMLS